LKPLPEATLARLKAANDLVLADAQAGTSPEDTIAGLIASHGAVKRYNCGTYTLRCATVVGSCTTGNAGDILRSWRRNAMVRIMGANQ